MNAAAAFSGVDTSNPIEAENGQTTASGTGHATPSITTTSADTMLVTAHTYAAPTNSRGSHIALSDTFRDSVGGARS